jgi:hypothetical protein
VSGRNSGGHPTSGNKPKACIYCRLSEPTIAFNREHVVPEGFGRFRNALVLHDLVCTGCNSYFGETLDRALARDSVEGLERYRAGVKRPGDISKFTSSTVTLRAHDAGEFTGAEIRIVSNESDTELRAEILPSAAIHEADGDEYVPFSQTAILDGSWRSDRVDWRKGVKLFGQDEETARMRRALEQQGVTLASYRPLAPLDPERGVPELLQEYTVGTVVHRAVSKIAFNYLAYRFGRDLALLTAFDPIRDFVRNGTDPTLPPVHVSHDLPFRTDRPVESRPQVHFVAIDGHGSHRNLLGSVTLFSYHGYTVILAEDFAGPWPELPLAHLYNVKTMHVSELEPQRPRWRHSDS